MAQNIENQIIERVKKNRRGEIFFADNFTIYGSATAIRKGLERLVKAGELDRIATGIYVRPKIDPIIGKVRPQTEEIAKAIAKRDHAKVAPTGAYALNRLGLSTQVPMNVVFLTDGAARKIKIGNSTITFKRTTPKNVGAVGEISSLVIQALRAIVEDEVTAEQIEHLQRLLSQEQTTKLRYDIRFAPEWIRDIMKSALNRKENESSVTE